MGKEDKEDSGFGFKDKAKAVETLKLLEQHDMNYRRLTVRGLLGRAKRVLSLTKAEEKIKNIKEAMEVFENWLAEQQDKSKEKQKDKKERKQKSSSSKSDNSENSDKDSGSSSSSDVEMEKEKEKEKVKEKEMPSESVPGLGFKDKDAAESTLKVLEGRDPDYQKLAVKGLIGRAKRVLTCTRDEKKLSNIKEAMSIFDKFLDDFDSMHMSKQNNPYLSLGLVRTAATLADSPTDQQFSFIAAYSSVRGEYKRLRTVTDSDSGQTWDIVRNTALKELKKKYADAKLFENDKPTKEHVELLLWAFSPEAAKIKKTLPETKDEEKDSERKESRKRKSSGEDRESPSKKQKE